MLAKCSLHWRERHSQLTGFPAINHCPKVCLLLVKNTKEAAQDGMRLWESQKVLILLPLMGSPRRIPLPFHIHTECNEAFYKLQ